MYEGNRLPDEVRTASPGWISEADFGRLLVFTHVPKTGGTSLKQIITINYGRHYADHHPRMQNLIEQIDAGDRDPDQVLAISSHVPYGIHRKIPGLDGRTVLPITVVRDPLKRMISYFNFVTTFRPHRLHQETKDLDINEFFTLGLAAGWGEISNSQVAVVSGRARERTAAATLEALDKEYFAYAALEDITELIQRTGELLGWPAQQEQERIANQSPRRSSWDDLTPEVATALVEANKEDIALYEHLLDVGPVVREDRLQP